MNKIELLVLAAMLTSLTASSQCGINYSYDAAGNRIKREICVSVAASNAEFSDQMALQQSEIQNRNSATTQNENSVVFPNPSTGIFYLRDEMYWSGANVKVISSQGVEQRNFILQEKEIDLTYLESGVYYLWIEKEKNIKTLKLLITK